LSGAADIGEASATRRSAAPRKCYALHAGRQGVPTRMPRKVRFATAASRAAGSRQRQRVQTKRQREVCA
jgi:hypothetical protein